MKNSDQGRQTMKNKERCIIKYIFTFLFEESVLNCRTKATGTNGSNSS